MLSFFDVDANMAARGEMENYKNEDYQIREIPLSKLNAFDGHPFKVRDDEEMKEMVESVKTCGVLQPAIVRPAKDGGYEILSGHRRKHACELAGRETIPAIVRELDDDAAIIFMVDSNLQRENILPSERAAAYKMKLDALKRQGARTDLTSGQVVPRLKESRARDIIAESTDECGRQIQRYVRLTELQPELQQMVDEKKMAFTPAVEISYLRPDEQKKLLDTIDSEQSTPSLSQAQRLKKLSQSGELTDDSILAIMSERKKPNNVTLTLPLDRLEKYFPGSASPKTIADTIFRLLDIWAKKRQRDYER